MGWDGHDGLHTDDDNDDNGYYYDDVDSLTTSNSPHTYICISDAIHPEPIHSIINIQIHLRQPILCLRSITTLPLSPLLNDQGPYHSEAASFALAPAASLSSRRPSHRATNYSSLLPQVLQLNPNSKMLCFYSGNFVFCSSKR